MSSLEEKNDTSIIDLNQQNLQPGEIHGGTGGAFAREQLSFTGFDGIEADVTLPQISNLVTGEQPWVYFGFDDPNYSQSVELGMSYQTGSYKWLPYICLGKVENETNKIYRYQTDAIYYDEDKIHLKAYVTQERRLNINNDVVIFEPEITLNIDDTVILSASKTFSDYTNLSVKRVTAIAKDGFNGSNITGKSLNIKWENTYVSKYNDEGFEPFNNYPLYDDWSGTKWYGTTNCTSNYIHRNQGKISIDKTPCDLNNDGQINVLDINLVSQYYGETGEPGWIREDINFDGEIDLFDMILLCQHWNG